MASQNIDAETVSLSAQKLGGSANTSWLENLINHEEVQYHQIAGFMGYLLQIIYQVSLKQLADSCLEVAVSDE